MDLIPITTLTPENAPPADKSIQAIVTLSWPYSSSTRQCALLLADPDFRLRNRKGQVRVRFTGASAEAVAKAHVGIGDEVVLALDGALWEQDSEALRTPGKSVDGELVYRRRLGLRVVRESGNVDVNVDADVSPARSPERADEIVTPMPKTVTGLRSGLDHAVESLPNYTYASPAFAKRLRLSGESFLDSAYDPFAVGDVNMGQLNERNQTYFGSGMRWRYADKTPSPKKVHFGEEERRVEESNDYLPELESPSKDPRSKRRMLPPPLPHLQMPAAQSTDDLPESGETSVSQQEGPSTPKIQPVQSSTLPMPSPFPTETRQVQFGLNRATAAQQDRTAELSTSMQPVEAEVNDSGRDQDVEMIHQHLDTTGTGLQEYLSDTEPDDELTQQTLMERHGVSVYDGTTEQGGVVETSKVPKQVSHAEHLLENYQARKPTESVQQMPRTPEKASAVTAQFNFGLGGASSAPPSAHVTPQSEKDKIMAQTYRSLFGFQESPESALQTPQGQVQAQKPKSSTQTAWFSDVAQSRLDADRTSTERNKGESRDEVVNEPVLPVEERRLPILAEQYASEKLQQQSLRPQKEAPSTRPSEVEVIDLASSSEGEEDHSRKPVSVPPATGPQRRGSRPEIQDSPADSQAGDLPPHDSQALLGRSAIGERRAQSSKLQKTIAEEPSEKPLAEASQSVPGMVKETSPQKSQDVDTITVDDNIDDQRKPASQILQSSPLSSLPPEISETLSANINEAQTKHIQQQTSYVISPLSSPPADLSELAISPFTAMFDETARNEVQGSVVEKQTYPYPDRLAEVRPTEGEGPATVIEIESSSPLEQPEMDLVHPKAGDEDILDDASRRTMQSELQVKSPIPIIGSSVELVDTETQEPVLHMSRQTMETPLYPSLPLSPSNSQSLHEMPSQNALHIIPETLTSALPPTPQLTQGESFHQAQVRASSLSSSSQLEVLQQSTQNQEVVEEEPSSLPQKKGPKRPSNSQLVAVAEEEVLPQSQKRTPARKSLSTRLSNVPDVISPWFSPKRSSLAAAQGRDLREEMDTERDVTRTSQTAVDGHTLAHSNRLPASRLDTNGFSTSLSYFTPLSRLEELLNPSSQQTYGTSTIDVLAVITDHTKDPVRAKGGPRDYFTIFKVSDQSLATQSDVRVEIYRPWMATLPVGSVGDVILLRGFAIKSRKRRPYLLSTDASAWCVWGYEDQVSSQGSDGRQIWARKRGSFSDGVREEVKGPPVELGNEEREKVSRLREWWLAVQAENAQDDADLNDMPNGSGLNGHANEPVSAKL